jgi:hypothetical protein
MSDPRDNKDDDTSPIKPLALTGIVLLSAGTGLAAGLLICWLLCCNGEADEPPQRIGSIASEYQPQQV